MKISWRRFSGGLALALAGSRLGLAAVHAELPPADQPAVLRTNPYPNDYGHFDGHGKLLFQEVDPQGGGDFLWLYTEVYYPRGSSEGLKLQHDLGAINVFLAAEIRRPATVRAFVEHYLAFFLQSHLSDYGFGIINQTIVDQGYGSEAPHPPQPSAAKRARLKAKLQGYVTPGKPVVSGKRWKLDVNVLVERGGLEHWLIQGGLDPLRVESFLCEPKEPDGTFYLPVLTR